MPDVIHALNNISTAWISLVVAIVWQSTLLALVVGAIARALRRSSPAVRYWLWQIVAIKLLAAPLWSTTLAIPWLGPAAIAPQIENRQQALADVSVDRAAAADEAVAADHRPGAPIARATIAGREALSWPAWLLVGWCAAIGLQLAQLAVQRRRLSILLRATTPAGGELVGTVDSIAHELGLSHPPHVLLMHANCSPFIHGAIRATLVLPQSLLATFSPVELRQVLAHELAHVKRHDLAWGWIGQIARMLYFFHPVAHWCYGRIRLERELACDQVAMSIGGEKAADYVKTLVRVVSHISQPPALRSAVAMLGAEGVWPGDQSARGPQLSQYERPLP